MWRIGCSLEAHETSRQKPLKKRFIFCGNVSNIDEVVAAFTGFDGDDETSDMLPGILDNVSRRSALPGTVGHLLSIYKRSPHFADIAAATQHGYERMMDLLKPIDAMPIAELTPPFIAGLRDRIAAKHGRRQANYVLAVISVACENGKKHTLISDNPVKGVKRLRRSRQIVRGPPSNGKPYRRRIRRSFVFRSRWQYLTGSAKVTSLHYPGLPFAMAASEARPVRQDKRFRYRCILGWQPSCRLGRRMTQLPWPRRPMARLSQSVVSTRPLSSSLDDWRRRAMSQTA